MKKLYAAVAALWLALSILVAVFVLGSYVFVWVHLHGIPNKGSSGNTAGASAVHSMSPSEFLTCDSQFIDATTWRYEPWDQFSTNPVHPSCFNIDAAEPQPIRRTINASAGKPNQKTIWLFGGQNTFGWSLPDKFTIASQLSSILGAEGANYTVINYGHPWYYSTQEEALFKELLRHGQKPDIAIFVDGYGEYEFGPGDQPLATDEISTLVAKKQEKVTKMITVSPQFPPLLALYKLLGRKSPNACCEDPKLGTPKYNAESIYEFNMSSIQRLADAENVKVAFFWEPTSYEYVAPPEKIHDETPGMRALNASVQQKINSKSFHFIADLFKSDPVSSVYVNERDYGDEGSRRVAQAIADGLKSQGILH
jgi:hypothetical protein